MSKKVDTFFSADERKMIEQTITDVEKKTSGEIVTMVIDQSGRYGDIDASASVIIGAAIAVYPAKLIFANAGWLLPRFIPIMSWVSAVPDSARFILGLASFILITLGLYLVVNPLLIRMSFLKRVFLSERRRVREIRERALQVFYERGLHNTRDGTGVLFLISLLEKRVYVLADHGIYSKINQTALDGYAESVGQGIAEKRAAEALCESIRTIGADLAEHFPARADDTNEISNEIITESGRK